MTADSSPSSNFSASVRENPLSRKLSKILDTRLENDKELLDSLNELSTFFTENNLRTRRNLRGDIERRSLQINEDFLSSFRGVRDSIEALYRETVEMNKTCVQMRDRLRASKHSVQDLISSTNELKAERDRLDTQKTLSNAFAKTFYLTQDERKLLGNSGKDVPGVCPEFFDALDRAKAVHTTSQILLSTGQQMAALEIRENMALFQESGLEKLYRWAQQQCRVRTGLNAPTEISPLLSKGMAYLQDRPLLFRYVLEEYCGCQRSELVRGFIDAMTRAEDGKKPIEMQAHDPPRYVGDMLAWIHQAVPSEIEALEQLLSKCQDELPVDDSVNADREKNIQTLKACKEKCLSQITDGLCRPLRARMEQVVLSEPGAVPLAMLDSTVTFYVGTLRQILPEKGNLMETLNDMAQLTHRTFIAALHNQAGRLAEGLKINGSLKAGQTSSGGVVAPGVPETGIAPGTAKPGGYLAPLPVVNTVAQLLKEVLQAQSMLEVEQREVPLILNSVLDPFLMALQESVAGSPPADAAAYMVNCLHLLHSTLSLYNFTDDKVASLKAQMDSNVEVLTNEQASFLVQRLGLGQIYMTLQKRTAAKGDPSSARNLIPLSQLAGMDANAIQSFVVKFNAYLAHLDGLTLPQVSAVLSAAARAAIRKKCSQVILLIYKQLYDEVTDPANGYDASKLLTSTPEQIESLIT